MNDKNEAVQGTSRGMRKCILKKKNFFDVKMELNEMNWYSDGTFLLGLKNIKNHWINIEKKLRWKF